MADKKPKVTGGLFADTSKPQPKAPTPPAPELASTDPDAIPTGSRRRKPRPETKKVEAVSVALHYREFEELQQIANSVRPVSVKRGNVLSFAVRYFLNEYRAGRVQMKSSIAGMLELPDGYEYPEE